MKSRKLRASDQTFQGTCQRCAGSGLWQQRAGYECRACEGTGQITVAVGNWTKLGDVITMQVVTPKGTISKEKYQAKARLSRALKRYRSGSTIGSGPYSDYSHTDAEGAAVTVTGIYAMGYADIETGALIVQLPHGGHGRTGQQVGWDDEANTIEVEVTEKVAWDALQLAAANY